MSTLNSAALIKATNVVIRLLKIANSHTNQVGMQSLLIQAYLPQYFSTLTKDIKLKYTNSGIALKQQYPAVTSSIKEQGVKLVFNYYYNGKQLTRQEKDVVKAYSNGTVII